MSRIVTNVVRPSVLSAPTVDEKHLTARKYHQLRARKSVSTCAYIHTSLDSKVRTDNERLRYHESPRNTRKPHNEPEIPIHRPRHVPNKRPHERQKTCLDTESRRPYQREIRIYPFL